MKKLSLLIVIMLAFGSLFANPVDVNRANELGQKFVNANFTQKSSVLELVYTGNSENGEPCFYVFNISDYGYIMVSASDCAHPILAYSEESTFDVNNVAPGLSDMMHVYTEAITYAIESNATATLDIASEWKSLETSGKTRPQMRGQEIEPLCTTKWNQSWPYNKFCPTQPASWSSNGHAVVGCVATAMAQIMKYWNYPTQGQGTKTYIPYCQECHSNSYPQQTVNFGATTYDWANMADAVSSTSPVEQIDAIATISYHCGVSVEMMYDHHGTGSGAFSTDVPAAISNYFKYAPSTVVNRQNTPTWDEDLRNAIKMGRPVYYSGFDENGGGHAFVCDGYDENGLFHFNFGWGGASDGYFTTEAMEYHVNSSAIMDWMPMEVYQSTAQAPTALTVTPAANNELSATLTWTNPSKLINGLSITSIDKIVIERNGKIIHEENNPSAGASMTYVDNKVPSYSFFDYSVYAVINGNMGNAVNKELVGFGPTCEWKLILQSSAFQGMRGASVSIYDAAGVEFAKKTTTSSSATTFDINVPLGYVQFAFNPHAANQPSYTLSVVVKNSNGETVYSYTGASEEMASGVFLNTENTCGNSSQCDTPSNLSFDTNNGEMKLSWTGAGNPTYGYNIYRDGLLVGLSKETSFVDEDMPYGGHCYTVTALCDGGNSAHSNEVCAVMTEGCEPATNLELKVNDKVKAELYWTKPSNSELSGYYVMRRAGEDGEWTRIKILGPNKEEYKDNSSLTIGTWYYYKVIAFYQDIDCMSAPAKAKNNNEYFVKFYHSEVSVDELTEGQIGIYPNPADDQVTIEAAAIENVTVFNMMGQKVYESSVNADKVVLNISDYQAGIYMINVVTADYETTKRISVVH
ncbi:MAG: C10 family peptidase [Bacteroidales bacterium]|nr:C10 family peptidase [Bacteroidales bacterium]